jgi:hypothetical protein
MNFRPKAVPVVMLEYVDHERFRLLEILRCCLTNDEAVARDWWMLSRHR